MNSFLGYDYLALSCLSHRPTICMDFFRGSPARALNSLWGVTSIRIIVLYRNRCYKASVACLTQSGLKAKSGLLVGVVVVSLESERASTDTIS